MEPKPGATIVVWFSCGAASAVAAYETLRRYSDTCTVRIVNNPVIEEDHDNVRFMADVLAWWRRYWPDLEIETAVNPKYPNASAEEVWIKERGMAFIGGATCTEKVKKFARYAYEKRVNVDWHVLGSTADEQRRHDRFVLGEHSNIIPVLIEMGYTKQDCASFLEKTVGIALPRVYGMGMPNANCIGCVKARSITYWQLIREKWPEIFERRAKLSRELGCRLVGYKGKDIFLDELPLDAKGRPMKHLSVDCGIFCEEKPNGLDT